MYFVNTHDKVKRLGECSPFNLPNRHNYTFPDISVSEIL